jgi:hypothetical protein
MQGLLLNPVYDIRMLPSTLHQNRDTTQAANMDMKDFLSTRNMLQNRHDPQAGIMPKG